MTDERMLSDNPAASMRRGCTSKPLPACATSPKACAPNEKIAELRRLSDAFGAAAAAGDLVRSVDVMRDFYAVLLAGTGNRVMRDLLSEFPARISFLRGRSMSQPGRIALSVREIRRWSMPSNGVTRRRRRSHAASMYSMLRARPSERWLARRTDRTLRMMLCPGSNRPSGRNHMRKPDDSQVIGSPGSGDRPGAARHLAANCRPEPSTMSTAMLTLRTPSSTGIGATTSMRMRTALRAVVRSIY